MPQHKLPFADQVEPTAARPMPRLSEQLAGPADPEHCQACGAVCDLARWREHDDRDRPEPIVVLLCLRCSDRLIEKHPRLYAELHRNAPWPGAMALCIRCRHRAGLRCSHAAAKANGGNGVKLTIARPSTMHVCCSPRRLSRSYVVWPQAATACEQREVFAVVGEDT